MRQLATPARSVRTRPAPRPLVIPEQPADQTQQAGPVLPARLTRFRGGTYSPTVETVRFADGTTARTDLVRLNPNVRAYSIDYDGAVAGTPVRYAPTSWARASALRARFRALPVETVVARSYPAVGLRELSAELRAAGLLTGTANLREHEAIAATQAAIWKLTNDRDLDTGRRATPVAVGVGGQSASAHPVINDPQHGVSVDAQVGAGTPLHLDVEFGQQSILAGVSVRVESAIPSGRLALRVLRLGRDGPSEIHASTVTASREHVVRIPPLASVDSAGSGGVHGYRRYRVEVTSASRHRGPIAVRDLTFELSGASRHRNADGVVALYTHLLAAAAEAQTAAPRRGAAAGPIDMADATVDDDGRLGPLRHTGDAPARISARWESAESESSVVVAPGAEFFLDCPDVAASAPARCELRVAARAAGPRPVVLVAGGALTPLITTVPAPVEQVSAVAFTVLSVADRHSAARR